MVAHWISGPTCSGKTQQLLSFADETGADPQQPLLIFAANGDNRIVLSNRLMETLGDRVATFTTSPAGFIQDEIILFWPLLVQQLDNVQAQFPLKLRPENEQMLATELWRSHIDSGALQIEGWREARMVRRTLDFLQLASQACLPIEEIPALLKAGISGSLAPAAIWDVVGEALIDWQNWCLQRGLLTYGIMSSLYWRYLLPMEQYQAQLLTRFRGVLADDVDEYPAISASLFSKFLEADRPCLFTYNPNGKARLGLGADPEALLPLSARCQITELEIPTTDSLGKWGDDFAHWVEDPLAIPAMPSEVSLLQATSRGQMLRITAEAIAHVIESGQAQTDEIAVIGPGLDAIGRYSLIEILSNRGIALESLNDQRPLISSPMVRALLSLLCLIYPGLGRLVDRDAIAEMLVVLSQSLSPTPTLSKKTSTSYPLAADSVSPAPPKEDSSEDPSENWFDLTTIDPVRAELIADNCFVPDIENPHLLPAETFARWDRLGYQTVNAYNRILQWLEGQKQLRQQRLTLKPVMTVDRIIQDFLWRGNHLPYDQLATLRELMETAQYFWEVEDRLRLVDGKTRKSNANASSQLSDVGRFVQLIQKGTVSANPYPVNPLSLHRKGVTLSTIYQYRVQRLRHRWQFWLDAGSPLWASSAGELFGAPLFLQNWPGRPLTLVEMEDANEANLSRTLRDLLGRATEKIFLCHSDLALTGQEQMGPLLSLIGATEPADESLLPVSA